MQLTESGFFLAERGVQLDNGVTPLWHEPICCVHEVAAAKKLHGTELPTSPAQDHKLYQLISQHHSTSWKAAKAWQMVGKDVKCGIRVTFLRHFVGPANQI